MNFILISNKSLSTYLFVVLFFIGSYILINQITIVDATAAPSEITKAEALKVCEKKANKAACVTRVNAVNKTSAQCRSNPSASGCTYRGAVAVGDPVKPKECLNVADPQDCQTKCKNRSAQACVAVLGAASSVTAGVEKVAENADQEAFSLSAKGEKPYTCGSGEDAVKTSINFGCKGVGNPIEDFAYAMIRFLSYGVGLVIVASLIYAGIQYTSSSGSPEATAKAKARILNSIIGLLFYLLIFALIQYLVPGGLFK